MTFAVKYACPHCGRRIHHKPDLAGQTVICSACNGKFIEPTDPLPGKDAERNPSPLPDQPPEVYQSRDYSLALVNNTPGGGMQTMSEVFEAQVIDNKPQPKPVAKQDAYAWPPSMTTPAKTPDTNLPTPARMQPPPTAQRATSPTPMPPALPTPSAIPYANRPGSSLPPIAANLASSAKAGQSSIGKAPIPVAGLAGLSPQQMLDELGRRGLVCVLLVHDYSEEDSAQIRHTQHLNTTQAISLLAEYLLKLQQTGTAEEGKAGMLAAVKRLWSGDEDFLDAAGRMFNKRDDNAHPK